MIISYVALLPIDIPHAVAIDIGITIKPNPVRDKVIEIDVVAIITDVSNGFSIVFIILYFVFFFFDSLFLSLK